MRKKTVNTIVGWSKVEETEVICRRHLVGQGQEEKDLGGSLLY